MKKNTDFSERINEVIDFVGVSKNIFAKKLDYERSQSIYDITNGKSKPSFDFFKRLLNSEYSEIINIEYIISGKGNLDKRKMQKMPPNETVAKRVAFLEKTKNAKNATLSETYTEILEQLVLLHRETISDKKHIIELQQKNAKLEKENTKLNQKNAQLRQENERLRAVIKKGKETTRENKEAV